ncbi:Hypothetical predicted protein [Podarcis lilfordi]|uniref:Uncharacterized protein n=1 Tax=Podarcis lilfordi TaxID=74358 RepID=A0AA35LN73_9SAUR|nr:Hypothetical predicted protein [Podarcis lilfordi]
MHCWDSSGRAFGGPLRPSFFAGTLNEAPTSRGRPAPPNGRLGPTALNQHGGGGASFALSFRLRVSRALDVKEAGLLC